MADNNALDATTVVASIRAVEVASLSEDELAQLVLEAEVLLNAVHALSAVVLEEFHRRGIWAQEGAPSAAGWAAARTNTPISQLRTRVRTGAGLRQLPSAASPARAGRLSPQHLTALAGCARRHPDLAARDEALLVDQAMALDAESFRVVARAWEEKAEAVDSADPASASTAEPVDELHVSRTFDGRYQVDGSFGLESGALLSAALDAMVDHQLRAARDGDPSVAPSASQVRAAALVDLVAQNMRGEPSESSVPDRYRVAVVVRADQTADLPLAACDSAGFRAVLGARGEVLAIGRLTQQWPAGIRRAITLRDGGCVFTGCDRKPSWCDIHHCLPWKAGGPTTIANGALLCRRHHTFIHKFGWTVTTEGGRPIVRKPDGSPYEIDRWSAATPYRFPEAS